MVDSNKHVGFPLPPEMFHAEVIPTVDIDEEWNKHTAYSELLDIPLKCPHCGETLKTNERRKEKRKDS
mgnify:CR=1 FL=1|tara:strand:+ start:1153 stop:1356 length:204 start_codon:yes stop_codon:yes gene_type:complete